MLVYLFCLFRDFILQSTVVLANEPSLYISILNSVQWVKMQENILEGLLLYMNLMIQGK